MREQPDDVPLSRLARLSRDFLIFVRVLTRRLAHYAVLGTFSLCKGINCVFAVFLRVKNFLIRLLLRRTGFFAPMQRLGFLTLSGTAVFSLVLLPSLDSVSSSYQMQKVLEANVTAEEGEILAASGDTLMQRQTTAVVKPSDPIRQQVIKYKVKGGDTLSSIGEKYLVSVEALKYVNKLSENTLLHPGDQIVIPPVDGLIYKVKEGDTIAAIAAKHNVSPQAIVDANLIEVPFIIHAGDELVVPGGVVPAPEPVPQLASDQTKTPAVGGLSLQPIEGAAGSGALVMPTAGTITQYFSWYHPAIDIANRSCGTPIVAADSGTIYFAGWWKGGGGNAIMINHGNGLVTKYAHMSGFKRTSGSVNKGEVIGYTGATGRAYGCHLHYVVEKAGRAVNPLGL